MHLSYDNLALKANQMRTKVLEMVIRHGGHIASSFSCVEILVSLYYDIDDKGGRTNNDAAQIGYLRTSSITGNNTGLISS